ncbi:MAG: endonuclease domain-containing protein [Clostridia bacterium]|nr:endonuclease domain-containing protein [Clostridia bacterium]
MPLSYEPKAKANAKVLRANATRQERHLWYDFLSGYPVRFQRQKPIGSRIVDFYCSRARLAVELDGSQHYSEEGMTADALRTEELSAYGVRVLRFSNADIDLRFDAVCLSIDDTVRRYLAETEE